MDKLEQYLDQVCRCIGGTRALRQHVRQELREHLLDAVTQHRAAGLTEEVALERALAEFGKPEEVKSELEAAHGQRMMAVVIDKALQWKERTMKAKWLWTTWAHLALAVVIALEALLIAFHVVFIVPRFQKLMRDGIIDVAIIDRTDAASAPGLLMGLSQALGQHTTWLLLGAIAAVGLFEWRVKSENKTIIRLAALGTAAVALMVVVVLLSASLVVTFTLGVPAVARLSRPFALDQIARIDASVDGLEQGLTKKDWNAMQEHGSRASQALDDLTNMATVVRTLAFSGEAPNVMTEAKLIDNMREQLQAVNDDLRATRQAIAGQDIGRLETSLRQLRQSYGPVREAAKRLSR